jgi:DNA polymerase I
MIKAFKEGLDIHALTAAEINEVALDDVTREMRREAKAINFGILYGQGPHGLSQTAGIPYARAKEFIEQYFSVYVGIKDYVETCIASAQKKGYALTMLGRKRLLPDINSSVIQVRKAAERTAVNTPLQGTAADIIKIAMIRADKLIDSWKSKFKMILTVHDELVFEIRSEDVKMLAPLLKKNMENAIQLSVPLVVDVSVGPSWGDLEKIT